MILLELVPKNRDTFLSETSDLLMQFPQISGINIPDITRIPIRSYTAASPLLEHKIRTIPHLRTIDHSLADSLEIVNTLVKKGLTHLLIITGDPIPNTPPPTFIVPTTCELVAACKARFPNLTIYCGLDPYRQSFIKELHYCQEKLTAGADGFLTQPFFDEKLASIYVEQLSHTTLFLGITPVLTEKNKAYWENRNQAIFPKSFVLNMENNVQIAKTLMALADQFHQHTYLMPITVSPEEYLPYLFH